MTAPIGFEYVRKGTAEYDEAIARFRRFYRGKQPAGRIVRCLACAKVMTGYGAPTHRGMHEREYDMSAEDYIPLLAGLRKAAAE